VSENPFGLTREQANSLLTVLRDLGEENLSTLHVAGQAVYVPMHWDHERARVYAEAVERVVFTAMRPA
jgi:hypothetical protein